MTDKTDTAPQHKQDETAKLKTLHRHRGELKHEGDTIKARPDTIARLREKGIVA